MTHRRAADFSQATRDLLAKRVAYLCSRISCRRSTIGPHSGAQSVTLIGEAAHIASASPGGPRHDPSMTDGERSSPENGVWLCAACATEVDKDPDRFPSWLLRNWKSQAESEALKLLESPTARKLGLIPPPFPPPLTYQISALTQVLEHLRRSGVLSAEAAQLARVVPDMSLRDGINPVFEPLRLEDVSQALDELIRLGTIRLEGQTIVLGG